ncbi:NADPH-dependent oxidoreductase [uncultured Phocaeicola sp.]|uniref:NADPH-dependent oxidoreductase n=1 Tax=uncultured Phocaeicola sp. TaxID=990718 RepID=UPI0025DAB034|nr:NADPH-dependent oxidoreductase [uncultured Phocaeicola sp.]
MDSIKNRRTIRKYTDQDIPDSLLNDLLEQAFRAPTMGNMQLYSVIVTRDPERKKRIAPAHFNQPMVTSAPVVLTFCADFNRFCEWCRLRDARAGYDNFLSFLNAASDTLLVTQNFCTLAEAEGLGTCYLGTTLYSAGQLIEALELPRLVIPVATITVGYPDEYPDQPERLPIEGLIHQETYHAYTDEDINRIYEAKEAMPENRHFVEINHTENLAQVFTDYRYTKEANEAISKVLLETLKKQGFLE